MGAEVSITSGNFLSRTGQLSKTPVQVFRVRAAQLHLAWRSLQLHACPCTWPWKKADLCDCPAPFLLFKGCPYSSIPSV